MFFYKITKMHTVLLQIYRFLVQCSLESSISACACGIVQVMWIFCNGYIIMHVRIHVKCIIHMLLISF